MWVTERKSISQADYLKYKDASKVELEEYVRWAAAHFSEYPPAGYGMNNPRVEMVDKWSYFAVWDRSDNCD